MAEGRAGRVGISIHAPRTGSDRHGDAGVPDDGDFNPRSPHGERRPPSMWTQMATSISIHAPRTGSDSKPARSGGIGLSFQSTLPARGATVMRCTRTPRAKSFQSTLPARGATTFASQRVQAASYFNPRSPHGERRSTSTPRWSAPRFQSTLPARGATDAAREADEIARISIHAPRTGSDHLRRRAVLPADYFNPRSPHGERPCTLADVVRGTAISIHAPRTGSDETGSSRSREAAKFQSTLPARGATVRRDVPPPCVAISIHAPRTGSDCAGAFSSSTRARFQSTLPARGATTVSNLQPSTGCNFNPRSPHGERPCDCDGAEGDGCDFNPRSPHGERRNHTARTLRNLVFQSTLPARGATSARNQRTPTGAISIHAPRTGSDRRSI